MSEDPEVIQWMDDNKWFQHYQHYCNNVEFFKACAKYPGALRVIETYFTGNAIDLFEAIIMQARPSVLLFLYRNRNVDLTKLKSGASNGYDRLKSYVDNEYALESEVSAARTIMVALEIKHGLRRL